jgi:type I restriction enzyme S subunit
MTDVWSLVPLAEVLTRSEEQLEIQPDQQYRQVTVRLWGSGVVLRYEVSGTRISARKRRVVRSQQFILYGAIVSNDFPSFEINKQRLEPRFLEWMSKTR